MATAAFHGWCGTSYLAILAPSGVESLTEDDLIVPALDGLAPARLRVPGLAQVRTLAKQYGDVMLVITRYRVDPLDAAGFRDRAQVAIDTLAARPGWIRGNVGRAVDDPALWVIATEWENIGTYRRALSTFEVKVAAVPLLSEALDEPSAFELLTSGDRGALAADADQVGLGNAAAPNVRTDLDESS